MWPWLASVQLIGTVSLLMAQCPPRVPNYPFVDITACTSDICELNCFPLESTFPPPTTTCGGDNQWTEPVSSCEPSICKICDCSRLSVKCSSLDLELETMFQGTGDITDFTFIDIGVSSSFSFESLLDGKERGTLLFQEIRGSVPRLTIPLLHTRLLLSTIPGMKEWPIFLENTQITTLYLRELPAMNHVDLSDIREKMPNLRFVHMRQPLPPFINEKNHVYSSIFSIELVQLEPLQLKTVVAFAPNPTRSLVLLTDCFTHITTEYSFVRNTLTSMGYSGFFRSADIDVLVSMPLLSSTEELDIKFFSNHLSCAIQMLDPGYYYPSCDCYLLGLQNVSHCPPKPSFACSSGKEIDMKQVCDGSSDCDDGQDERDCIAYVEPLDDSTNKSFVNYFSLLECIKPLRLAVSGGVVHEAETRRPACGLLQGLMTSWDTLEGVIGVSTFRLVRASPTRLVMLLKFREKNEPITVDLTVRVRVVQGSLFGMTPSSQVDESAYDTDSAFETAWQRSSPDANVVDNCYDELQGSTTAPLTEPSPSQSATGNDPTVIALAVGFSVLFVFCILLLMWVTRKRRVAGSASMFYFMTAKTEFQRRYARIIGDMATFEESFGARYMSLGKLNHGRMLHQGEFGPVYQTVLLDKQQCSTHVMLEKLTSEIGSQQIKFVMQCYVHHLLARHKNILKFEALDCNSQPPMRAMMLMSGGSLDAFIVSHKPSHRDRFCMLAQVASAMTYLESLKVLHRALCCEHVLVSGDGSHVCITGFTEARDVYETETYIASHDLNGSVSMTMNQVYRGNPQALRFLAPEAIEDGEYTAKTDIFAFGVLMIEVFVESQLHWADDNRTHDRLPPLSAAIPSQAVQFIAHCCQKQPSNRPTAFGLLSLLDLASIDNRLAQLGKVSDISQWADFSSIELLSEFEQMGEIQSCGARFRASAGAIPLATLQQRSACRWITAHPKSGSIMWHQWQHDVQLLPKLSHDHLMPVLAISQMPASGSMRQCYGILVPPSQSLIEFGATGGVEQHVLCGMVVVDTLLALEYLGAQQLSPRSLELHHCRVVDRCLKLEALTFFRRHEADHMRTLKQYQELLVMCSEALELLKAMPSFLQLAFDVCDPQRLQQLQTAATASLLSMAAVHAQDLCHVGEQAWQIKWEDVTFVKQLGSGQFGEVALMQLCDTAVSPNGSSSLSARRQSVHAKAGQEPKATALSRTASSSRDRLVAVKSLLDGDMASDFHAEMAMMRSLRHPNLVSLLHVIEGEKPALVMEYLSGGSFLDWLECNGSTAVDEQLLLILYQASAGLVELHRIQIVHRDLAARNVLVSADGMTAKLSDYGLSRMMNVNYGHNQCYYRMSTARPLPIRWLAPSATKTKKFTAATDVYSFGCLMYEAFSKGDTPLGEETDVAVFAILGDASRKLQGLKDNTQPMGPLFRAPSTFALGLSNLLHACVEINDACRPNTEQVNERLAPAHWPQLLGQSSMPTTVHLAGEQDEEEESHL